MTTDPKLAELEQAILEASSDILKNLMEVMADPEGGISIDQIEALIGGHVLPVIRRLLDAKDAEIASAYQRGVADGIESIQRARTHNE